VVSRHARAAEPLSSSAPVFIAQEKGDFRNVELALLERDGREYHDVILASPSTVSALSCCRLAI